MRLAVDKAPSGQAIAAVVKVMAAARMVMMGFWSWCRVAHQVSFAPVPQP